jgi:CRISPR-associated endonuclease Cas1/CRISPR-associated protein Cas4
MLNESVYCPRLFYLMHVMGEWAPSVDTAEGRSIHRRVDRRQEAFPEADGRDPDDPRVTARSIMLSSECLGIIAKMDLVESAGNEAIPVEYKHGRPPANAERSWPPERIQLCAQGLILEEQGWVCDHGLLYFPTSKEKVEVSFDDNLRKQTLDAIKRARMLEVQTEIPPPLEDSPKCPRCSLVGICLPDETRLLRGSAGFDGEENLGAGIRRLIPASDDALPLHLTEAGSRVGLKSRRLVVRGRELPDRTIRLKDVSQVNLFGGVQISTQAVNALLREGLSIGYFSSGGWFNGVCSGLGHSSVLLRRRQYARSADSGWALGLAKDLVRNKIRNARTMLRRNHKGTPEEALRRLRGLAEDALGVSGTEMLLGVEGLAARIYFQELDGMLVGPTEGGMAFEFGGRNRRPPRDPVNAMLSLAYSILCRHFTAACAVVGLDPHLGFYHRDRPGRPSLALDLMEPFRPILADSAVVTAVNNREVVLDHFIHVGPACTLTNEGRRRFISCFERRLDTEVRHPVFGYRISYRRVVEVQTRLLARFIHGELACYPAFETR